MQRASIIQASHTCDPVSIPGLRILSVSCVEKRHTAFRLLLLGLVQMSPPPESNQGPSDVCSVLQSDAPPTELWPAMESGAHSVNAFSQLCYSNRRGPESQMYRMHQRRFSKQPTVWPSGLRRWLKAPVRKGVGSNPTAVTSLHKKIGTVRGLFTCCGLSSP